MKKIRLSDEALNELDVLARAVEEIVRTTVDTFISNDIEAASRVEPLEEYIDELCD